MECFIIKDGVEQKAELDEIIPLIPDREIRNIFRGAYKSHINLQFALAYMAGDVKDLIFRNMSPRIGGILGRSVIDAESKNERDISYMRAARAKLITYIGDYIKKWPNEYPENIVWKEKEQKEEIQVKEPPNYIEKLMETIEKACDSGQLKISIYDTGNMTEEDIRKAFTAFQNRKDELQRIHNLEIQGKDLPAAALLFETGALEDLEIYGEFTGTWPPFLEKCHAFKSINLSLWKGLTEFPSWIRNAVSLQRLSIRESHLATLPDWIGDLQSITELSIDYYNRNLKTLPESIGKLKNLTKLSIRSSGVEKLPDNIGNLSSLTELEIGCNNNLKTLPDSIGNLKNLVKFNLCHLPIEVLPEWIGNLQNLTQLSLVGNYKIKEIPNSIGKLKMLRKLDLSGLSIKRLPDCIGDLDNLAELSLCNNKNLKSIPDSIGKLKNLVKFDLSDSSIESLPKTIIDCTSLDYIDMRRTNINSVPEFISSTKSIKQSIGLIPKEQSISYGSFCNCYYRLVETILQLSNKARREGLLALEEDLENFSDDFFKIGMRLTVDGTDLEIIQQMLTLRIEREHDYNKKKLMEIALEGIICVYSGDDIERIILKLSSLTDIKNNPLEAACAEYLAGDYTAFDNIDLKAALQPEEECEELRFIRRVMAISNILRTEGIFGLEKHLDYEGIKARDVFEYGLPFFFDDCCYEYIDKILTSLIAHETNPVRKNLALAKKDAVWRLYVRDNPRLIVARLLGYFDYGIERSILAEFD